MKFEKAMEALQVIEASYEGDRKCTTVAEVAFTRYGDETKMRLSISGCPGAVTTALVEAGFSVGFYDGRADVDLRWKDETCPF